MNVACMLLSVYIALHGGAYPARATSHPIPAITKETTRINTATTTSSTSSSTTTVSKTSANSIGNNLKQVSSSSIGTKKVSMPSLLCVGCMLVCICVCVCMNVFVSVCVLVCIYMCVYVCS